ncbi:MAG: hypothetical protein N2379_10000, partial [Verrucomicrobiae bacterium]|nr:hypothetical protein [Verrucomicrobiae bacterium]
MRQATVSSTFSSTPGSSQVNADAAQQKRFNGSLLPVHFTHRLSRTKMAKSENHYGVIQGSMSGGLRRCRAQR